MTTETETVAGAVESEPVAKRDREDADTAGTVAVPQTTEPSTARGAVTWESSDEDSGPDVGIDLGLGGGTLLRVGEISDRCHAEAGEDAAVLGSAGGWWLTIYPDGTPLAKFTSTEAARKFMDAMEGTIRG